ncbi:hypothetical protein ACJRO7_008207 [Eucalyptus globulus]|uniref:ATPase AAA-type core domain-containing protein n=1 Tax=Eucalyptus globulus TaxID=34317 RepID=A0ABD3IR38_EUCGL
MAEACRRYDLAKAAVVRYNAIKVNIEERPGDISKIVSFWDGEHKAIIAGSVEVSQRLKNQVKELNDLRDKLQLQRMTCWKKQVRTDEIRQFKHKNEKEWLVGLAENLHQKVVRQDQAIRAVEAAVMRSRAGLGRLQQTTASFLFLGPTSVGKTELVNALAEQTFDDKNLLIEINTYVGHGGGGELTEAVRRRPYSAVLFEGVEKAHRGVMNRVLQVLDEGRLTDGQGRTVDFRNTIIIMTSSLGAEHLLSGLKGDCSLQVAREKVMREVRRHFSPELLDRLDVIAVFDPLSHEQLRKVNGGWSVRRCLEDKVMTEVALMHMREEIDENSTLYIDAGPNGQDLVYRVEKNGGFVNAASGRKSDEDRRNGRW